jgi:hypothetical protein
VEKLFHGAFVKRVPAVWQSFWGRNDVKGAAKEFEQEKTYAEPRISRTLK